MGTLSTEAAVSAVIAAGKRAAERNWVPATSGNFSARIDAETAAMTRSGVDKGALTAADVLVQPLGAPLLPGSSAEAQLHVQLYRDLPGTAAIFHVHALAASVLAQAHRGDGAVTIEGWELQKAFAGIRTHAVAVEVPVFENDQDIDALADRVARRLAQPAPSGMVRAPGYLLAGHGLYAWGASPAEAQRHLDAFDALFNQIIMHRRYQP